MWVDCEMTGLDLRRDALIEIAALVTDSELHILGEGVDVVIPRRTELLDGMLPVVREMHAASGLTDAVRASTMTRRRGRAQVLDYVRKYVPEPRTAPLCGNSIATDRAFLARDMPQLDAYLHYRMIDVSSIKELCRRWYPRVYFGQPQKGLAHRALADIQESIRELRYYRRRCSCRCPGRPASRPRRPPRRCCRRRPGSGRLPMAGRASGHMVGVAQLVEHRVVVPGVAGSSPVTHPIGSTGSSSPGCPCPGWSAAGVPATSTASPSCEIRRTTAVRRGQVDAAVRDVGLALLGHRPRAECTNSPLLEMRVAYSTAVR